MDACILAVGLSKIHFIKKSVSGKCFNEPAELCAWSPTILSIEIYKLIIYLTLPR